MNFVKKQPSFETPDVDKFKNLTIHTTCFWEALPEWTSSKIRSLYN